MTKKDLMDLLRQAGSRETDQDTIEDWLQAGLPVNADGTVDFLELIRFLLGAEEL